jgi:sec-independent protein translocase protein TatC
MPPNAKTPDGGMSFLEHLDELRSRLFKAVLAYVIVFIACWNFSSTILEFLLRPIRKHLFEGGEIIFIHLTEPFAVYMKAAAVAALFVAAPYILYQLWSFVAPGLYRNERLLGVAFLLSGTLFFVAGGAFGYYVATPLAARWLLQLGEGFKASLTLQSAFQFESRMIVAMGLVFELPLLIVFLSRIGIVTPGFLVYHLRIAIIIIGVFAAIITPSGDMLTMVIFMAPMVGLYLLGILVAWIFERRSPGSGS